jgi:UDP-N-acetylbacillosamine N-acetyltransferase
MATLAEAAVPPRLPIVVWGASWHARVVAEIIVQDPRFSLLGFLDDVSQASETAVLGGWPVLGGRERFARLSEEGVRTVALGFGNDAARLALAESLLGEGLSLPYLVHPAASVSASATLGAGTVVAAGAIVGPGASLGRACIVNTGAIVEHDCRIDDGAHVGPGACMGGLVAVGRCAWIGVGASVRDRVRIAPRALVGTGAAVVSDIPEAMVAIGVPARAIRHRRDDE